jgi:hypothetical protein
MKILLVHPEDDPEKGSRAGLQCDRIVDLGLGGVNTYERWNQRFHCPIATLGLWREKFGALPRTRELFGLGSGYLIDQHGLDWWEMISMLMHGEVESLILLQHFVSTLGANDELYVSRPGLHADLLRCLLGRPVNICPLRTSAGKKGLGHYARVSRRLSASQAIDVFWDKYDAGYQWRGRLNTNKRSSSRHPLVLLPTAYVNVSRTSIAYANSFPEEKFLLVATRRSGWTKHPPQNVGTAWLSRYASLRDRTDENAAMALNWQSLMSNLRQIDEFEILHSLGRLDFFGRWILRGFEVRDAWLNVLDRERIHGVLCADDSNPYTRIPLLLAQERGLPNIACHHGALDGRYFFKRTYADLIWARGNMEKDYLVRVCGVPAERIEIGAPALPHNWKEQAGTRNQASREHILFLSEATDQAGARTEEFYRETLPALADLALTRNRKLIVKLHPAESERERNDMIARILSAEQKAVTSIVGGPLTEKLLDKAWFGITVLSTVAMECAVRGITCFLCRWLECWPYGYVDQFIRFGVGIALNDPSEIKNIPDYLEKNFVSPGVRENCWRPADPGRLREILAASRKVYVSATA